MTNDLTIGVDLGGTKLLIVSGEQRSQIQTGASFTSAQLEAQIRRFLRRLDRIPDGIGVAVPSLIDRAGCVIACDVLPEIVGWNPVKALVDIRCPIKVINDVKAALLEEFHDSEANLTAGVVMVGTAVAAFQIGGLPLLGASGWAGELGYLPLFINSEVKRLDDLAGGALIARRLGTDGQGLAARVQAGDEKALIAVQEGGYTLGIALAAVINLLNPSKLALGGGTVELPEYTDAAYQAAKRFSLPELWNVCSLSRVKSGDAVVALGAARFTALEQSRRQSDAS